MYVILRLELADVVELDSVTELSVRVNVVASAVSWLPIERRARRNRRAANAPVIFTLEPPQAIELLKKIVRPILNGFTGDRTLIEANDESERRNDPSIGASARVSAFPP